ncbi:MAG: hypothetical protein MZV70_62235 [Desulfobacterales bacterium]|nr:hypothetical protein [Desulfobacterales bacterium]
MRRILARKKYRVGMEIGRKALVADSKETIACALPSVAPLLGLGLNYVAGIWWADPIAALCRRLLSFQRRLGRVKRGRRGASDPTSSAGQA